MSIRNATATWSGFSHQGQVGLLIALSQIKKLRSEGKEDELEIHFLEYENTEDCAIFKKQVDHDQEYLSVHQVKAYYSKGDKMSTYEEVFKGKPEYEVDDNGKYIKKDGKKVKTGKFISGQWCQNDNFLHTTVDITDWDDDKAKTTDTPAVLIKRYQYPNGELFCDTNKISELLLDELKEKFDNNEGKAKRALDQLTFILDEKIRTEHKTGKSKKDYNIVFSLKEVEAFAESDEVLFKENVFECRKLFYNLFMRLCEEENLSEEHQEELLKNVVLPIYDEDDGVFFKFLQNLNLNLSETELQSTQVLFNNDGLEQVFFDILFNVEKELPVTNDMKLWKYQSESYVLTAIIKESRKSKQVIQNILSNLKSQKILWEKSILVNKEIDGNFHDLNPEFFNVSDAEQKDEDFKQFMKTSRATSFISREKAKENLNNENIDK